MLHPESPTIGAIVECINPKRRLKDPGGYKVEHLGSSEGYGTPYGFFTARGVAYGGLYSFSVTEYKLI